MKSVRTAVAAAALAIAVDAAGNNHAPRMLVRDVDNLRRFFGRFAPELTATDYGKEIWALYESGATSERFSGRMPTVTERPLRACAGSSIGTSCKGRKFICVEPTKPATNRFSGAL